MLYYVKAKVRWLPVNAAPIHHRYVNCFFVQGSKAVERHHAIQLGSMGSRHRGVVGDRVLRQQRQVGALAMQLHSLAALA